MKVYADKLPENCKKCPYFIEGGFLCRMNDYKMLDMVGENSVWNGRDEDCPLQSLADHDKQVRKEVVQEIRKFAYDTFKEFGCFDEVDLEHILDKIKGETK